MAVLRDTSFGVFSSATPIAVSGTIAANSNRVLIAVLTSNTASTISAFTWNTTENLTLIGTANVTAGVGYVYVYGLINPTSGNHSLSCSFSGSSIVNLVGISFYNADQVTGWQNNGSDVATGTPASSTVTSANGNYVVVGSAVNNGAVPTLTQGDSEYVDTAHDGNYAVATRASTGSSTVVSWTIGAVEWANYKVDVIASGAGAANNAIFYIKA